MKKSIVAIVAVGIMGLAVADANACRHRRGGGGSGGGANASYAGGGYNQAAYAYPVQQGYASGSLADMAPFYNSPVYWPQQAAPSATVAKPVQKLPAGNPGSNEASEPGQPQRYKPGTIWRADENGVLRPFTPGRE